MISFLSVFFTACDNKTEVKEEKKVLKVGMELAYPPFEMSDKEGIPQGVSVDFAKKLGEELGMEVVIENTAWSGLIPSLKTGKIDLIISSMTITKERQRSINFSIPYAQSSLAILANKNSGVQNIDDLDKAGKKVAVKKGSTGHVYVSKNFKNADVLVFDKEIVIYGQDLVIQERENDLLIARGEERIQNIQENRENQALQGFGNQLNVAKQNISTGITDFVSSGLSLAGSGQNNSTQTIDNNTVSTNAVNPFTTNFDLNFDDTLLV